MKGGKKQTYLSGCHSADGRLISGQASQDPLIFIFPRTGLSALFLFLLLDGWEY